MSELPDSAAIAVHNAESLQTLLRALQLSTGQFSLLFARCDYLDLREQIRAQLQAQCPLTLQTVTLPPTTETIFTAIQQQLGDAQPEALMVFGLETVQSLDRVLRATNLIREEFRKRFTCPIVIWIQSSILHKLIRHAPDLENWATTIAFESTNAELIALVQQRVEDVLAQILTCREHLFLDATALGLQPDSPQGLEWQAACQALAERALTLAPPLQASLALVQGLIADNTTAVARDHYQRSLAIAQTLPPSVEQGYSQFYLGLWWGNRAARQLPQRETALVQAVEQLRGAIATFEQLERPDLVAQFITYLAAALHRQAAWDDLAQLIPQALAVLAAHPDPLRQARIQGFQAEVALARQERATAKGLANQALEQMKTGLAALGTDHSPSDVTLVDWVTTYHQGWYLYTLGRAEQQLGNLAAAQKTLEQAKATAQAPYDPDLYLGILNTLRELYFNQGDYLRAFDLKLERRTIESQFGYSAFIGAGRLQAKQRITNPSLPTVAQSTVVAQEIAASGRQQDVNRLLIRMGRDDHKLTVVYGQSGVGKSSMLQAGFIPALTPQAIKARTVAIVLQQVYANWEAVFGNCLLEALHRHALQHDLPASLPAHSPPATPAVTEHLQQIRQVVEEQNSLVVLVFDQFEEFFFEYKDTAQRKPFYDFLKQCLDIGFVKVVLSLREDYLNYLLECNRLENLAAINNNILDKNILFYVGNFTPEDGRSVIKQLTAETAFQLEPDLIEVLVKDLSEDFGEVRPIELQVVGAQLQAEHLTTLTEYQEKGPKERLVERFLEDVVTDCGQGNEQLARLVLYLLTDENNTRPLRTRADLEMELDLESGKLDLILAVLVKSRLVFQIPSSPEDRFQLVHDYLVVFVRQQKSAETTRLIAEVEQEREKRKITEAQLERALQERERALVWRFGLGALAAGLMMILPYVWTVQNNSYLRELTTKSERLLSSDKDLESLTEALKAGRRLNRWWSFGIEPATRVAVTARLQDVVYGSRLVNILEGHKDSVNVVEFSSDDQYIVSGGADSTVRVWDLAGQELATMEGHEESITAVAISEDDQFIVSGSTDKTVKLWNFEGEEVQTFEGHKDSVSSVAISPDNKTVISGGEDGVLVLWKVGNPEEYNSFPQAGRTTNIIFSDDGQKFWTGSESGEIILWELDGNRDLTFESIEDEFLGIARYGDRIMSRGWGQLNVWDLSGNFIRGFGITFNVSFLSGGASSLTYSGRAKQVALTSPFTGFTKDIQVKRLDINDHFWNYNHRKIVPETLKGHQNTVNDIIMNKTGELIVSASADKKVNIWNAGFKFDVRRRRKINGVLVLNENRILTSSEGAYDEIFKDPKLHIWNPFTRLRDEVLLGSFDFASSSEGIANSKKRKNTYMLDSQGKTTKVLMGSPIVNEIETGESLIATISEHHNGVFDIHVYNVADGVLLTTLDGHKSQIHSITFSKNKKLIAIVDESGKLQVWDILQRSRVSSIDLDKSKTSNLTFNSTNTQITISRTDNKLQTYSVASGELITTDLAVVKDKPLKPSFSSTGKHIALIKEKGEGSEIELWNSSLSHKRILWSDKENKVDSVRFTPNDKFAFISEQSKTHIVQVSDSSLISTIEDSYEAISANGKFLLKIDSKNVVKILGHDGKLIGDLKLDIPSSRRYSLDFYFDEDPGHLIINNPYREVVTIYDLVNKKLTFSIPYEDLVDDTDILDDYQEFTIKTIPNSRSIAVKTPENSLKIISLSSGYIVQEYSESWDTIEDFFFMEDGNLMVVGGDYQTSLYNPSDPEFLKDIPTEHDEHINGIAMNLNGRLVATVSDDNTATIYDLDNKEMVILEEHTDDVIDVNFSPTEDILATSSEDKTIKIWTTSGERIDTYDEIHNNQVNSVKFSPDGQSLVTSSDDKTAVLVSLETRETEEFPHDFKVVNAAFSPDGEFIYTATPETINIWSLDGTLLATYQRLGNTDFDFIDEDPTDDQYSLVTAGGYEPKIIEFDLKTLLTKGCQTAKNYLKHNKSVDESDRKICDEFLD
ncbi:MAG: hypothetical protein AAGG51_09895 [Cyanobacteria bacterium P01_G01_bin.54]